jgi:1-acyl-sn-glycerol-3-phosphate acyltransferase
MSEQHRVLPPTAEQIEQMLNGLPVRLTKPALHGAIGVVGFIRRMQFVPCGLEHLDKVPAPVIFAANHESHADTAAIICSLPPHWRKRTAVAAALDVFGRNGADAAPSLKRMWLEWIVAAGFNAFSFDRHGPPLRSLRTSVQLIRNGWSLLLYPEGTRSRDGTMRGFKAGVSVLARFSGRPVVPIHVSGGGEVLPCGMLLPRPGRITVRFGAALHHGEHESPEAFTARVQSEVGRLGGLTEAELATLPPVIRHAPY